MYLNHRAGALSCMKPDPISILWFVLNHQSTYAYSISWLKTYLEKVDAYSCLQYMLHWRRSLKKRDPRERISFVYIPNKVYQILSYGYGLENLFDIVNNNV